MALFWTLKVRDSTLAQGFQADHFNWTNLRDSLWSLPRGCSVYIRQALRRDPVPCVEDWKAFGCLCRWGFISLLISGGRVKRINVL